MLKAILHYMCLLLIFTSGSLFAEMGSSLEVRPTVFIPSSNLFKNIYGNSGASYQLEACTHNMFRNVDLWSNFDWFSKKGKTDGLNDPTRVNIVTISVGVKIPYQLTTQLKPYIGIGASLATLWLENKTHCSHEKVSKVSLGGILKSGIYYYFQKNIFIDLFFDYSYQPIHFETQVDIGGIKAGLGLGVEF